MALVRLEPQGGSEANYFYIDAGDRVAIFNGEPRSSLVMDPADGRFPPLTRAAQETRKQPKVHPRKYAPPNRPMDTVEKCSSDALTGINTLCSPWPASRIATPNSNVTIGAIARIKAQPCRS